MCCDSWYVVVCAVVHSVLYGVVFGVFCAMLWFLVLVVVWCFVVYVGVLGCIEVYLDVFRCNICVFR